MRPVSMELAAQLISFNRHLALDRVGGDAELLREVAQLYLEEYPRLLKEIEESVRHVDADSLQRSAHTLKGSLGTLGAERATRLALDLELMGRGKKMTGADETLVELSEALEKLHDELAAVAA